MGVTCFQTGLEIRQLKIWDISKDTLVGRSRIGRYRETFRFYYCFGMADLQLICQIRRRRRKEFPTIKTGRRQDSTYQQHSHNPQPYTSVALAFPCKSPQVLFMRADYHKRREKKRTDVLRGSTQCFHVVMTRNVGQPEVCHLHKSITI